MLKLFHVLIKLACNPLFFSILSYSIVEYRAYEEPQAIADYQAFNDEGKKRDPRVPFIELS
jgi:hypothetical protein